MHGAGTTGSAGSRPSLREWFYGLYVISPVTGLSCHRQSSDSLSPATLAPASGRQDHTISPSASCRSSRNMPRPSHAASNTRDDREAPLLKEAGRRKEATDLGSAPSGIFLARGLDDPNQLEAACEIRFCAHTNFGGRKATTGEASCRNSSDLPVRQNQHWDRHSSGRRNVLGKGQRIAVVVQ